MKNLKKYIKAAVGFIAAASLGISATSCDDLLDTKPQGAFTTEQIGDEEAIDLMTAAYATLMCHYFGNNESFAGPINNWVFDVRADDAYKGGDGVTMEAYMHQLEVGNVQSDNPIGDFKWRNNYYSISRCNTAIRALAAAGNLDDKARQSYIAEMKTLRAYYYFDMLRIFKMFPYFDETVTNPSECRADEYTRDEIAGFIKEDLRAAYKVLPESQEQVGRFNRYVAAALHAKVSAFTSSWNEVVTYADYVIGSGKYQLYNNFLDMSKVEFNNSYESIMAIQFSTANNNANINWCNLLNTTYSDGNLFGNGDDFFLASQNLVNAFRTDENGLPYLDGSYNDRNVTTDFDGNVDPRLDFTVGRIGMPFRGHTYTMGWTRAYDVYGEYSGKKGLISPESPDMVQGFPWGASPLNFCLIRYADIVLLKAEAMIELNSDLAGARELINSVRRKAARSVDASYTPVDCNPMIASYYVAEYPAAGWTQDYARRAVRMERRLELAMEGNRWFDLVRWGTVVETMNAYYASESKLRPYYKDANLTQSEVFFPIPLSEVENSGGLYE